MRKSFLFLFLAAANAPVWGNDTAVWEYPDGSGVIPMSEGRISMLAETVNITVDTGRLMMVSAVFWFKNLTNKPLEITMGFPFEETWGEMFRVEPPEDTTHPAAADSMDFVSLVDGQEVKTHLAPQKSGTTRSFNRGFYYIWDVKFGPGQVRRLESRYRTRWDAWYDVAGRFGYSLKYTTTTWTGTIGEAVVRMEIPRELPRQGVEDLSIAFWRIRPPEGVLDEEKRVVSWHFKDWKPQEDILVEIRGQGYLKTPYLYGEVDELADSSVQPNLDHPWTKREIKNFVLGMMLPSQALQFFINTVYALAGHEFSDSSLAAFFGNFDWYRPKKPLKLSDLPRDYRKTVEAAAELRDEYRKAEERVQKGPYGEFLGEFAVLFFYTPVWDFDQGGFKAYLPNDPEKQKTWLRLARNAFYARAGKTFKDPALAEFFSLMPWYSPGDFAGLSEDEQAVVDAMVAYEKEKGFR